MDQQGLEQLADAFDYAISPREVNMDVLQPRLDADQAAYNQRMLDAVQTYGGFTEYLLEQAHQFPKWQYCFYDLDGNGMEELLLGRTGTGFTRYCILREGEVYERIWLGDIRPLENGGLLMREMPGEGEDTSFRYFASLPDGKHMRFDFSGNGSGTEYGEMLLGMQFQEGQWRKFYQKEPGYTAISQEEAQAVIAGYPEKKLDWQPLWEYPLDTQGNTLGQVLTQRKNPMTQAEALPFYRDAIQRGELSLGEEMTHFALRDVNGDGSVDLLLSPDGEKIWRIYACFYGKPLYWSSMVNHLCEDDIFLQYDLLSGEDGADLEYYCFRKCTTPTQQEVVAELQYNRASGTWTDLVSGGEIPAARAEALIAGYPRILLDWQLLDKLKG